VFWRCHHDHRRHHHSCCECRYARDVHRDAKPALPQASLFSVTPPSPRYLNEDDVIRADAVRRLRCVGADALFDLPWPADSVAFFFRQAS